MRENSPKYPFYYKMLKHVSFSLALCILLFSYKEEEGFIGFFLSKTIESEHFPPLQKEKKYLEKEKIMGGFFPPLNLFGEEGQGTMSGFSLC